jgi:hypothetical protein
MSKNTVVVMSPADVSAMRRATKEANEAYFEAKVGALRMTIEEMEKTHEEYTLHELSAMSGLSPQEVVAQMSRFRDCKAAREADVHRNRVIYRGGRTTERRFVEILPDGRLNLDSVKVIESYESTFQVM